ncbi:MAG: family 10 glycosylhydrolase [Verrucomicrobiota bacterium]
MNFNPSRWCAAVAALLVLAGRVFAAQFSYVPSDADPPSVDREFRGLWIATVANRDWPSKPNLTVAEQKSELIAILDFARSLKLNAVILQVRPACDALYASPIEPWSEYLTGAMGRAPSPFYDPLAFAVEEAHRRGLELHAWFNPYRALHFTSTSRMASNHVSRTHPDLVKRYGKYLWLDPGERATRDYTLDVVSDVVRRYDIDGVHFDDYFYPDKADSGTDQDFPDDASWRKAQRRAPVENLTRDAWRRQNVNTFIERAYRTIKQIKPWVKLGVSPRGIWRPSNPPGIKGMDAYATIYADSRKWLMNGWVDYFSPQLYWPTTSRDQNFAALLSWWVRQDVEGRHLWPGLAVYRAPDWPPGEVQAQIDTIRRQSGAGGYLCYNTSSLMRNEDLARSFRSSINLRPALVPGSPWMGGTAPGRPSVTSSASSGLRLDLTASRPGARWWLIQSRVNGDWRTEIQSAAESVKRFAAPLPDLVAVTEINRFGLAGPAAVLERRTASASPAHEAHPNH